MDFKFITIFKIFILAFAILSFIFPWTDSVGFDSGYDGSIGPTPHYYSSGYDYVLGCQPIPDYSFFAKMPYLIFNPIILFISLLFSLYEKRKYVIGSMIVGVVSTAPVITWISHLSRLAPAYHVGLSIGPLLAFLMVAINIVLGFMTLAFCDLDNGKKREQKADQAKTN